MSQRKVHIYSSTFLTDSMQSLPLLTGVDKNKRQEDDSERNVRRRVEGERFADTFRRRKLQRSPSLSKWPPLRWRIFLFASAIEALQYVPALEHVRKSHVPHHSVEIVRDAGAMRYNNINLSYNNIGDDGAIEIAGALQHVTSLTTLDLRLNSIGRDGAIAIANAFGNVRSLTRLDLSYNNIRDTGAEAIAGGAAKRSLTHLDLIHNRKLRWRNRNCKRTRLSLDSI